MRIRAWRVNAEDIRMAWNDYLVQHRPRAEDSVREVDTPRSDTQADADWYALEHAFEQFDRQCAKADERWEMLLPQR